MKPAKQDNPFTPGTGHSPPLLAGRDEETRLLALMLDRLNGPRTAEQAKLAREPFPPIKIVGPRGAGKTALLGWTKERAKQQNIRFVTCERLKQDKGQDAMLLLRDIAGPLKNALSLIKGFGFNVAGKAGASMELHQANVFFTKVTEAVVKKEPLLLLLDEVHHYDLAMLAWLLQGSQKLIAEGYPLGVVLAGTPGLDSHLDKAESTFIFRSEHVYIHTLSDAATRKALREPFRQADVDVAPDALKRWRRRPTTTLSSSSWWDRKSGMRWRKPAARTSTSGWSGGLRKRLGKAGTSSTTGPGSGCTPATCCRTPTK